MTHEILGTTRLATDSDLESLSESTSAQLHHLLVDATDCAAVGMVLVDSNGRILWGNQESVRILGYPAQELTDRSFDTLLLESASHLLSNWLHRARPDPLQSHARRDQPVLLRHKTGGLVRCAIGITVSGTAADPVLVVSLFDLGELSRLERELKQQIAALNRLEVAQFLAGKLLHDFNNILAAISGHVGLARSADSKCDVDAALDTILHASNRGAELIRRLRGVPDDCSTGASVRWQHVAQEALSLLRGAVPKAIRLEWSLSDETAPVACTESEAHQVVMNLGMNAAASMRAHGGLLLVTLRQVVLGENQTSVQPGAQCASYACLTVKDTGCGMTRETMTQAFQPFFSTKSDGSSSGLGLCVVKEVIARHKGFIEVESALGVGTEFRVFLPVGR